MKIFYLKKDEILKNIGLEELERFSDGKEYLSEEKYFEHLCWLYLLNHAGPDYLGIVDTTVVYEDKKPVLKSGEYNFSVSHSENLVVIGFSRNNIGIDVEKMKERDFQRLAKRYGIPPKKNEFYKFWTKYEAVIKLGTTPKYETSEIIEKDYMLTCVLDSEEVGLEIIKF